MARKKERIMAFDIIQPDSLHPATQRICRNFVCYESKVKDMLFKEDRGENWKHDANVQKDFNTITGYQTELRGGIGNLGIDMVSLIPVTLEKSVKNTTPYIYRIADYSTSRSNEVYGTRKDALQYIQKKIKTKNVQLRYNGTMDRQEFSTEYIEKVFEGLEEDTIDCTVEPIGRGDVEGDPILITIYKNCL